MVSSDFVSVETFSDEASIWPDPCTGGGGTSVARLVVNDRLARPFSASSTDGTSGIGMVDEEFGGNKPPLNSRHP